MNFDKIGVKNHISSLKRLIKSILCDKIFEHLR